MKKLNLPNRAVNVKGMFIGVYLDGSGPVFLKLEKQTFLPIFSTADKYNEAMKIANITGAKIQIITDHNEFMDSVYGKVRLMLDPYLTDHGTTRFAELSPSYLSN